MANVYDFVSVTIDGKRYDKVLDKVEVTRESHGAYGCDLRGLMRPPPTDITIEVTVPIEGPHAFAALFQQEPAGASAQTLAKRVRYGGRKGRSAMRRLLARAAPVEFAMGPAELRFRGRCTMINEGEVVVRAKQDRRRR